MIGSGKGNRAREPWDEVMREMPDMPVVKLKNGLRVGNHSSAHAFTFDDGSVLPACTGGRARAYKLVPVERFWPSPCGRWKDVDLDFELPAKVILSLIATAARDDVDVILVALPVLILVREADWLDDDCVREKVRAIRKVSRVGDVIFSDKFCI